MAEHARYADTAGSERAGHEPFSLEANLARQHAEFAGGPTMADLLNDMDRYRRPSHTDSDSIVESLEAVRSERDEQLDTTWRQ